MKTKKTKPRKAAAMTVDRLVAEARANMDPGPRPAQTHAHLLLMLEALLCMALESFDYNSAPASTPAVVCRGLATLVADLRVVAGGGE